MSKSSQYNIKVLSKEEFDFLAKYKDLYCISVYLPSLLKHKNPIQRIQDVLLNRLNNAKSNDKLHGLNRESIQEHLRDLKLLILKWKETDKEFNLAIFLSNEILKTYEVAREIPSKIYINNHFYLKFFAQEFNADEQPLTHYLRNKKLEKIISNDIHEIIKLSAQGEIQVLLLEKNKDLIGELDEENNYVIELNTEKNGTSLSNIAAVHTILNNGNVFVVEKEKMPNPSQPINAIIKSKK